MISSGNENIVEIKHKLLCTKLELARARKEANIEIKKYEDTIKGLFKLLKRVSQERDEAIDKLQFLLRNFHQPNSAEASTTITQVGHHPRPPKVKNTKILDLTESMIDSRLITLDLSSKPFTNCSCDLALASPQSNENHFGYQVSQTKNENSHSFMESSHARNVESNTSLVIDKLDWEKPLPQKGRPLQTVTEARQSQNPHYLSLSCFSPQDNDFSTKAYDKESGDNPSSVVLTSLSLAFPENSYGPSHMSSEKIEPLFYEDTDPCRMHNHVLTGKKRTFLSLHAS